MLPPARRSPEGWRSGTLGGTPRGRGETTVVTGSAAPRFQPPRKRRMFPNVPSPRSPSSPHGQAGCPSPCANRSPAASFGICKPLASTSARLSADQQPCNWPNRNLAIGRYRKLQLDAPQSCNQPHSKPAISRSPTNHRSRLQARHSETRLLEALEGSPVVLIQALHSRRGALRPDAPPVQCPPRM